MSRPYSPGDIQEALREYADHAHIAALLNRENSRNREEIHKEIALIVERAMDVYDEALRQLTERNDADEIAAERSDVAHDRRVDDRLTEAA